jgi:GNAT superfamily N-acetyltransferase
MALESAILDELRVGDAGWLIMRSSELCAAEEGFDETFETLVAGMLATFLERQDTNRERGWIAREGSMRLGSIFCVQGSEPDVAILRLFFLEPEARGLGLGRKLMDACQSFAREANYKRMTLWTHESHKAACALYSRSGFTCVRAQAVHSFGLNVVEQVWECSL